MKRINNNGSKFSRRRICFGGLSIFFFDFLFWFLSEFENKSRMRNFRVVGTSAIIPAICLTNNSTPYLSLTLCRYTHIDMHFTSRARCAARASLRNIRRAICIRMCRARVILSYVSTILRLSRSWPIFGSSFCCNFLLFIHIYYKLCHTDHVFRRDEAFAIPLRNVFDLPLVRMAFDVSSSPSKGQIEGFSFRFFVSIALCWPTRVCAEEGQIICPDSDDDTRSHRKLHLRLRKSIDELLTRCGSGKFG